MTSGPASAITIGLAAHQQFCPRRAWLEAQGEATDTAQMAVGVAQHGATDDRTQGRSDQFRAIDVEHVEWGYRGRCDTVEVDPDGALIVVEYKATPVRRRPEVTRAMVMQLALQVAALRSMGHTVRGQAVFFTGHQRRVPVSLDVDDFAAARRLVGEARTTIEAADAPPALEDDPRCSRCSHVSVCLPDERRLAPAVRRIVVSDPDSQVVHLATPGSRASIRSGRLRVIKGGDELATIPIERVQGVVVHGNVDLSGGLIRELLWRRLALVWCTSSGRVVGWASSGHSPNGGSRVRQHVASAEGRLDLAQEFVGAKVANQATLLRRNGDPGAGLVRLRALSRAAGSSGSVDELFGIEGEAASLYFASFATMIRVPDLTFDVRTRRPAQDEINAALNYAYALLLGDVIRAVRSCGMDPHAGFLHSSSRNKPALALDLAEELRAPVADSAVIRAFNNGEMGRADFLRRLDGVVLTERGRKSMIAAYERRVCSEFTHPTFGYRVTWRRAMEVQARLVLGVLDGSQPEYVGIRVR